MNENTPPKMEVKKAASCGLSQGRLACQKSAKISTPIDLDSDEM